MYGDLEGLNQKCDPCPIGMWSPGAFVNATSGVRVPIPNCRVCGDGNIDTNGFDACQHAPDGRSE